MEGVASCQNHPDREAIGICVRCRRRNCSECVTKIDGINYCVGCLADLARAAGSVEARAGGSGSRASGTLWVVGWILLLYPLTWLMLWAAAPSGG